MTFPLSFDFYIRDLSKFESNIVQMLAQYGYRVEEQSEGSIVFGKGNYLRNFFAYDVLSVKNKISVDFKDNNVHLQLEVFMLGQVFTLKDESVWKEFIHRIMQSMQAESTTYLPIKDLKLKSLKKIAIYFTYFILGIVIIGIPLQYGLKWIWPDLDRDLGGIIGLLTGFYIKYKIDMRVEK